MATETDLEERLRSAFDAQAAGRHLPRHVLFDSQAIGRRQLRRRRLMQRSAVAGAVAVFVGVGFVVVQDRDQSIEPGRPAPTSPTSPAADTSDLTRSMGEWAAGLPLGDPPDVPYLAGTTVVQPDGTRVQLTATPPSVVVNAAVIGQTVAGLVLLVEDEVEKPYSFSSRFVLVTNMGQVVDLDASTLTKDAAQEALISPDGTKFTNGGPIWDVATWAVVGQVPAQAEVLISWTPSGIIYSTGGTASRYVLWPEGGEPIDLSERPGIFPNGTDVGSYSPEDGPDTCSDVVRMAGSGAVADLSSDCIVGLWAVSPSGRWALTYEFQLVDVTTGDTQALSDTPVTPSRYSKVLWDGDDSLTFSIRGLGHALLVRCDTGSGGCERITEPEPVDGSDASIGLP